ncbi:MAG: hypothetical protein J3K34DRAFT_444818, partial [Monoraphidium minutum]
RAISRPARCSGRFPGPPDQQVAPCTSGCIPGCSSADGTLPPGPLALAQQPNALPLVLLPPRRSPVQGAPLPTAAGPNSKHGRADAALAAGGARGRRLRERPGHAALALGARRRRARAGDAPQGAAPGGGAHAAARQLALGVWHSGRAGLEPEAARRARRVAVAGRRRQPPGDAKGGGQPPLAARGRPDAAPRGVALAGARRAAGRRRRG